MEKSFQKSYPRLKSFGSFVIKNKRLFFSSSLSVFLIISLVSSVVIYKPFQAPSKSLAVSAPFQKIWMWGDNSYGQLGDGTTTSRNAPVQVSGLSGSFTQVVASGSFTVALKSDGTVWTWGLNNEGELGNGSTDSNAHSTPAQVSSLSDVVQIAAAGSGSVFVLKADGTVWMWGLNNGMAGDGCTSSCTANYTSPTQVKDSSGTGHLSNVVKIAAGQADGIALTSDGNVWVWGDNFYGEVGNGTYLSSGYTVLPTQTTISNVKDIFGGGNEEVFAIKADGTVYGWGKNVSSELAVTSTSTCSSSLACNKTPVQLSNLSKIVSLSSGEDSSNYNSTLELKSDGSLWLSGTSNNPPAESGTYTSGIVSVGKETTWTELVLKSDGTVWAWGNNWDGELGNGSNTNSTTPVQVSNITNVGAISAGGTFAAALSN